ncbi:hypothetical protein D6810_01670 [Candidatus Dojkabacteria bacterium]|uniref:Peptidyl-prolyl cis-trans isomerase n=1 Tax=Candidatus Dojkabacteria bacterium TaxID=2099670 RepID=A0A3M0YZP0_9BACT|nr:MAG: hypothetical protein D6810_01670 [Candidatus Dojkabacteria bacterium]
MKNWKNVFLMLFILTSFLIISGRTGPENSNERKPVVVSQPRLNTLDSTNLPTFSEKFTELKTEILLPSNLEKTRIYKGDKNFRVNYRGWLASNGKIFDQNIASGNNENFIELNPKNLIPGFFQGVIGMKVGEIRRIYIPSNLGYGESETETIPKNSDLIFDVELISF